jgi:hypothetical protein
VSIFLLNSFYLLFFNKTKVSFGQAKRKRIKDVTIRMNDYPKNAETSASSVALTHIQAGVATDNHYNRLNIPFTGRPG